MAPHAGYRYSGALAGIAFGSVEVPARVIVLCPNHTGAGVRASVWPNGAWNLPLGNVPVDEELARLLVAETVLEPDFEAHRREHAIEVELPFLLVRQPKLECVPICLARLSLSECVALGEGIAKVTRALGQDVLLVASSDMSHYISAEQAKQLDEQALARMTALDPEGLHRTVETQQISMCGYVPATVALAYARACRATRSELLGYGNSGDASGDRDRVVGYAAVRVT
jgi:MEMO1 family protein